MKEYQTGRQVDKRCWLITLVCASIATFVIGILIGRFATCPEEKMGTGTEGLFLPGVSESLMRDEDLTIVNNILQQVNADNIRTYLRMLTTEPHLAGTYENKQLAEKLKVHWQDSGFDHVTLTPYHVLLSKPDMADLNYVELMDENNQTVYKSDLREPALTPDGNNSKIVPPFNAYSATGDVYGNMVYVNYGRVEDHLYLEHNTSISVSGKIVIVRYGKIFRGDKVRLAEMRGAIGVILFSDPEDYTSGDINQVYPHDWWLPPSGTQRGTIYIGDGDPLTYGYPSIDSAYREFSPHNFLPSIPCHPIGYGIAIHLMREMGGTVVPDHWQGGMNVTYRFGDGYMKPGWKAHIHVSTGNKNETIYNTIGVIRGGVEPDRYVLVGNHRDAWVFGSQDPSSGTAVMMELSRVLASLVKSGRWRPRRSIVFCSWGAEEYGLIGSTEYVEQYTKTLGARAVAYLNVDIAMEGNFSFWAHGTPLVMNAVLEATKKVTNPNMTEIAAGRKTVYDTWINTFPSSSGRSTPEVKIPGAGSDYAPFRDHIGVPIMDMGYTYDPSMPVNGYPMYHSAYETFYLVDEIMDRGFKYHRAVCQVWMEMARHLADSLLLPFNVSNYADVLNEMTSTMLASHRIQLEAHGVDTSLITVAVSNFTAEVQDFEKYMAAANLNDPFVVRRINDQLMDLNRAFLDPAGLPDRTLKRHILFAESTVDTYSGSSFPGLADALAKIDQGIDVDKQWQTVKRHYSVLLFTIRSAASTLKDVSDFMYNYL